MSFKNILVPHDFQDVAENALDNAIKIAKLCKDSKIIILHVLEEIPVPVMGTFFSKPLYSSKTGEAITPSVYIKEIFHDMRLDALKKLENKKQKCEKEDILCETKLIKGNPKKEITRYINQQKALIVYYEESIQTMIKETPEDTEEVIEEGTINRLLDW